MSRRQSCRRLCNIKPLLLLVSRDKKMALITITSASAGLSTEYLVELETKVKRRFAKISQSLRRLLLRPLLRHYAKRMLTHGK